MQHINVNKLLGLCILKYETTWLLSKFNENIESALFSKSTQIFLKENSTIELIDLNILNRQQIKKMLELVVEKTILLK